MGKTQSSSAFVKYPQDWDFGGKRVLNIGCGFAQYHANNVVNLDASDICKPNVVWDLNKTPLPFRDSEFDMVLANHILEHVNNWWAVVEDCARILKVGGKLEVWVPGTGSDAVRGYRDHVNEINMCSWFGVKELCRNPGNAWAAENANSLANKLSLKTQMYHMEGYWWLKMSPPFMRRWAATHLRNCVFEVGFIFERVAA